MIGQVHFGDCRDSLRAMSAAGVKVQTCVTSPPYFGLRDYGHDGQIGLEETPKQYIAAMVEVFRAVRNVLADDGTLWLNIGDSYATGTTASRQRGTRGIGADTEDAQNAVPRIGTPNGCKTKDLIGIPWMLAFALRADGWYLRQDIIWHKPNPMPESVTDRCTKAHEYLFLLSKSPRYYFDSDALKEPSVSPVVSGRYNHRGTEQYAVASGGINGNAQLFSRKNDGMRNRRSVWSIATKPYKGAHFAVFPAALVEPCILAGSRPGDIVLDPFMGSGTTAAVAIAHGRRFVGCELNPEYKPLQDERITEALDMRANQLEAQARAQAQGVLFGEVAA
jgi:DNA modification methylase